MELKKKRGIETQQLGESAVILHLLNLVNNTLGLQSLLKKKPLISGQAINSGDTVKLHSSARSTEEEYIRIIRKSL